MSVTVNTPALTEKINQWYEAIKSFHTEKSQELKKELSSQIVAVEQDSSTAQYYKLILFRYYLSLKDKKAAQETLENLEPFKESNELLQYYYYSFKGIYYYILNKYQDSVDNFKKAQPYIIFSDHQDEIGEFHYKLASSYYELYQNALSIKHLDSALTIFQKNYQYKRSADCELLLALNLQDLKEFEEAELHYHNALRYCDHFKDEDYKHTALFNLGLFYNSQKYFEEAVQYFNKSRKFFLEEKKTKYAIKATYQLAKLYFKVGDVETARHYQKDGIILSNEIEDRLHEQKFHTLSIYSTKDLNVHINEVVEGFSFFEENELWNDVIHLGEHLMNYYHEKEEYEQSSSVSQRIVHAKEKLSV